MDEMKQDISDPPRQCSVLPPWELPSAAPAMVKDQVLHLARDLFVCIAQEQYVFGSRLPSERELATQYVLTRAVVRQAIDLLERFEIIKRKPNSGAYVCYRVASGQPDAEHDRAARYLDLEFIATSASPLEMHTICSLIEPEIARLATLSMSSNDLDRLRRIVAELPPANHNAADYVALENTFFEALAEATHNRLMVTMYRVLGAVRRQHHWCSNRMASLSASQHKPGMGYLESLCRALECRDANAAAEIVRQNAARTKVSA